MISGSSVGIVGWDIDGISGFEFPSRTSIAPGGFALVVDLETTTAADFRNDHGVPAEVPIFEATFDPSFAP